MDFLDRLFSPLAFLDLIYLRDSLLRVIPFLFRYLKGTDTLLLPIIDAKKFSKFGPFPKSLIEFFYINKPYDPLRDGRSIFFTDLNDRGKNNERKKIYYSATTPDEIIHYRSAMQNFSRQIQKKENRGQPFLKLYRRYYMDLFWKVHLGLFEKDVPKPVREFSQSAQYVMGNYRPLSLTRYRNYRILLKNRGAYYQWMREQIQLISCAEEGSPRSKSFVYHWLKNKTEEESFSEKDIAIEGIHNIFSFTFPAVSIYKIIKESVEGNESVNRWFSHLREHINGENPRSEDFLDHFIMEVFRYTNPIGSVASRVIGKNQFAQTLLSNRSTLHWENPDDFNPDRFQKDRNAELFTDEKTCERTQIRCPFRAMSFSLFNRSSSLKNTVFGTVFPHKEGEKNPIYEYAGYSAFGYGYRRCPGEIFSVELLKIFFEELVKSDFLFKEISNYRRIPISLNTPLDDKFVIL